MRDLTVTGSPAAVKRDALLRRHPSLILFGLALVAVAVLAIEISKQERLRAQGLYQESLNVAAIQITRNTTGMLSEIQRNSFSLERELLQSGVLSLDRPFSRESVESVFRTFIQDKPMISQIRWLDAAGMERSRIDRRPAQNGEYAYPAAEILQDKSDRDYVRGTRQLEPGEFYNSYLSLNREFGEISLPHQPVTRTATRTHHSLGQRDGMLVINFDMSSYVDDIHQLADLLRVGIDILDPGDGRVYVSTEHPDLEFAHESQASPATLWDLFPARQAEQADFVASGARLKSTQHQLILRGQTAGIAVKTDEQDLRKHVWSRGSGIRMSDQGILFDIRIPSWRISSDQGAARLSLGLAIAVASLLIGAFSLMAFRLERRNIAALQEAKNLADAKSQFLANMSHEIRTPVTGIVGMLDLIDAAAETPETREKIHFVKQSTRSLKKIIDDILDVTKLQNNRVELNQSPFRPAETLDRVIQLYSAAAGKKGIKLTASAAPEIGDMIVIGDDFRIEQVLNNLVSNAIKFTENGAVNLGLSVSPSGDEQVHLCFSVEDTGIGIDPEVIDQLGEAFFQVDASTTRNFGGTGLGLSICSSLLALMGSRLEITSTRGEGTTISFQIQLPLCQAEPAPQRAGSLGQKQAGEDLSCSESQEAIFKARVREHGPPKILVVEDSLSMQLLIEAIFQSLDIPVSLAEHGGEAVRIVDVQAFDLVFMDLQMPVMGGVEATDKIRKKFGPDSLPIIILSATVQDEEIQACMAAGANGYLGKPIDMESLLAALLQFWNPLPDLS